MHFGVDADVTGSTVAITDLARAVEDAGLESLFVTQRIHLPASRRELLDADGHEMDAQLLDPFVALGAAAAVTTRLKVGTGACYCALYDPLILARQVATLDHVSRGRFVFGITPGWLEEGIRNHGLDPALRWRALREKVLAMKALWSQDGAEFHGSFVDFDPVCLGLTPLQQPHPPILVGSNGARGLRRAVEYGDEWFPVVTRELDLGAHMADLRRLCQEAGRSSMPVTAFVWELDEVLIERCAGMGVSRCVAYLYPERVEVVERFLEDCQRLAARHTD